MDREDLSPQEAAVYKHLTEAQEKIRALEMQLRNLQPDKGPQLKLAGGPVKALTRGQEQVEIEKQIAEAKSEMLQNVEREMKGMPPDAMERCDQAIDDVLYPEELKGDQSKDQQASQVYMSRQIRQQRMADQQQKSLERGDRKTMEESERYMYRLRYKQDMPEAEKAPHGKAERSPEKDLDRSLDYAYRSRYRNEPQEPSDAREHDRSKDDPEPEPEKD